MLTMISTLGAATLPLNPIDRCLSQEQNPGNYSSLQDLYFILFGSVQKDSLFHGFNIDFAL